MIIKKITTAYRDGNISTNTDPKNTAKSGKKLCFLSSPPKSRPGEPKEEWAIRFLEKIANDLEGPANGND
jgi:hypothetical protein